MYNRKSFGEGLLRPP